MNKGIRSSERSDYEDSIDSLIQEVRQEELEYQSYVEQENKDFVASYLKNIGII